MKRFQQRWLMVLGTLGLLAFAAACSGDTDLGTSNSANDGRLTIFATTGYLADAAQNIAPEAEVIAMVGPGGDPHTYQPSTQDIQLLQSADVVLWTGLHLEAQMTTQLESLGETQLAVGEQLPESLLLAWPETDDHGNPLKDPHIWNSPQAWIEVVKAIATHLGKVDPDRAAEYEANSQDYITQIEAADAQAAELLAAVPEDRRTLITGHDAFAYFGQTYGFDVHATDFISTEAQLSPSQLSDLADLIADEQVPVIFQDNQANPQAITSLQQAVASRGHTVVISDAELFADSLGSEAGVNTYLGVFAHNARTVAQALTPGASNDLGDQ